MSKVIFCAELNFIVPPKTNRYFQKGKLRFIPERVKVAIDDAISILSSFSPSKAIDYPCELYIRYTFKDRRKRDLDNLNKSLQDVLEKAGIIKDDALFKKTLAEKVYQKGVEKTEIYIFKEGTLPALEKLLGS